MPLIEPPADADSSPAAARPSEPASGQELAVLPRRSRDLLLRLGSLLCGLAAVSSCLYFSGPAQFGGVVAASGPSQPLGFSARPENGKLLLTWNADSEAARKAKRVVLSITDGDQKEDVDLSLPVFRKGALVYEPVTGRVTLRLTVSEDGAADTVESVQPTGSKGGDVPAAGIAAGGQTANAGTDAAAAASPPSDPRPSAAPAPAAHSPSIRDIPEPQAMDAQVKLVPVTTGLGGGHFPTPAPLLGPPAPEAKRDPVPVSTLAVAAPAPPPAAPEPQAKRDPTPAGTLAVAAAAPVAPALTPEVKRDAASAIPVPAAAGPQASAGPLRVASLKVLHSTAIPYPKFARRVDVSGTVTVEVRVGPDGRVREVAVISGPEMLWMAARAVKDWVFEPPVVDGKPVEAVTRVGVTFKPPDKR